MALVIALQACLPEINGVTVTAVPLTRHSRGNGNPGILVHSQISNLLDTRLRGYDTIPVLEFHVHDQFSTL